jgi:hypothetical protein
VNIHVPSLPKKWVLTQTMIEDFWIDPVLGARVLMGEEMDEFQKARARIYWWVPRVMDSSGFSSFKTRTAFVVQNLRLLIMPERVAGVYYQNFSVGQNTFWAYYDHFQGKSEIFRKHIGRMDLDMAESKKGTLKGPSCWQCYYRNGSKLMLPAPGFIRDAANQASIRLNDIVVDEFTKIEASGSTGIDDQLIGRCTRETYNRDHPVHRNHQLFTATAEDTCHPAYARYNVFRRAVDHGDPDYAILTYSFKDMSDQPCYNGKSFKKSFRETHVIKDMKLKFSRQKYLQEGLGIWSKNGRGWYSGESMEKCLELGKKLGYEPLVRRSDDPDKSDHVRYFMGVDPSKGDGKKSADGAMVVLRAAPKCEQPSDSVADWDLRYVWAYKVRNADVGQWSGLMHQKEKHFGLSGICMDHGGGGIWIRPELGKKKQIIHDVPVECVPIVTMDDTTVTHGNYILVMFNRSDDCIRRKWDSLKGEDNLIDAAHCELKETIDNGAIAFPKPFGEILPDVRNKWSEEKQWANRLLDLTRHQLESISVLTTTEGTYLLTRNMAHQFEGKGKKDFAYAAVHAYTRFLIWLQHSQDEYELSGNDVVQCY